MKTLIKTGHIKAFFTALILGFVQVIAMAQDKVTTTTHTETYTWYAEPWVWIVGGIGLIVLLALIFGGRTSNTTITHTTTKTE